MISMVTSLKDVRWGKKHEQSDDQTGCKETPRLAKLTGKANGKMTQTACC